MQSKDIREAVRFILNWKGEPQDRIYDINVGVLMDAATELADIRDQQAAEAAERAKPIDKEWLLSIGFRDAGPHVGHLCIHAPGSFTNHVHVWPSIDSVRLSNNVRCFKVGEMSTTTRGMMLSFLAGLAIPVTQ